MTLFEVFLSIYLTRRPWQMILPGRGGFAGFLFTVLTAVDLLFLVGEYEDMGKLLLYGSYTAGIPALDDVLDLAGQDQLLFVHDFAVLDYIDRDIVVDKAKDIKIHKINGAFDLHDILLTHLAALGVFDDRHAAVQLVQMEVFIDIHAPSGLYMVQHETFFNTSYIQCILYHYVIPPYLLT